MCVYRFPLQGNLTHKKNTHPLDTALHTPLGHNQSTHFYPRDAGTSYLCSAPAVW